MAATLKVPTIFTAVDKFSPVVKRMTKSVVKFSKTAGSHIKRFDQKITKSFKKMSSLAQAGIGLGVGFMARGAIDIVRNYEQAVADLGAVMNTTSENQTLLAKDAERLGAITARSATQVVGLQEAFARLGFETPQILNMTEGTISGSIAMNAELSDTAELVGAMIKTFDNFSSLDTTDIVDKMTLATQKSALNFEKLQTALPIVAGAANAAGIPFERTVALLGKLSDAGIDASSSSTALRNIFLESAKQGLSYDQILKKIVKESNKLTAANDEFGKRGAVSATILSGKLGEVDVMTNQLTDSMVFQGTAARAAEVRNNTFSGALTLLQSAYEGLLINSDKSSGSLKILTVMVKFVTKHINKFALVLGILLAAFIALKVVVGIMSAFTIALKVWRAATIAFTVVQWLFNAAMWANPVVFIIAAIIAAIALIIYAFKNWGAISDWFSKKWGQFTEFIGIAWRGLVKFFEEFSFKEFFMDIGNSIISFLLLPLKTVLKLIRMIPGEDIALVTKGLEFIDDLENTFSSPEVTVGGKNKSESNINISLNDPGGAVKSIDSSTAEGTDIVIGSTVGAS